MIDEPGKKSYLLASESLEYLNFESFEVEADLGRGWTRSISMSAALLPSSDGQLARARTSIAQARRCLNPGHLVAGININNSSSNKKP